ncbi:MAG: HIT domain-containing protein [archaeon]
MLTDEQAQSIKTHLLEQLENFPEEQRKIIKHKILSMNNEEMEEFLKENNLNASKEKEVTQKCIFCSIAKKNIKSFILDEDNDYLAILELNPLSKGHTLVIPKEHYPTDKLPENSIEFAKKLASHIFSKLEPTDIQFQKNEVLGHANLEIVPVYGEEKLERHRATEEELTELSKLLQLEKKEEVHKEEKKTEETDSLEKPKEEKEHKEKLPRVEEPKPLGTPIEELPKIKPRLKWI